MKPDQTIEIKLNKTDRNEFIESNTKNLFLCKIYDGWFCGRFSKEWYGLSFNNWGTSGIQLSSIEEVYWVTFL